MIPCAFSARVFTLRFGSDIRRISDLTWEADHAW